MKRTGLLCVFTLVLSLVAVAFTQDDEAHHGPQAGQVLFEANCAGCHSSDGTGGSGPALAGNNRLEDATLVGNQILHGRGRMPAFGSVLVDTQIAQIATYIRSAWGNDFGPITSAQVTELRSGQQGKPAVAKPFAVVVKVADASAADAHLTDSNGRTLYYFAIDGPEGSSHCYDPCTTRWLPLLTGKAPTAGSDLDASLLGVSQREDNTTQVTFNGWPLYHYAGDEKPGDMKGDMSDVWRVATTKLEPIGMGIGQ